MLIGIAVGQYLHHGLILSEVISLVGQYLHHGLILREVFSLMLTLIPTPSLLRFSDLLGAAQLSLTWILQPHSIPSFFLFFLVCSYVKMLFNFSIVND